MPRKKTQGSGSADPELGNVGQEERWQVPNRVHQVGEDRWCTSCGSSWQSALSKFCPNPDCDAHRADAAPTAAALKGQKRFLVLGPNGHPFLKPDARRYEDDALRPDEEVSGKEARRVRVELAFQSPDWSLGNVLSWIAFRDPAMNCRFETRWLNGRKHESRQRLFLYGSRSTGRKQRLMLVAKPDQALLAALQVGKLVAIRSGEKVRRRHWFGKDTRHLSDDLRFERAAVMKCWRAGGDEVAGTAIGSDSDPQTVHPITRDRPAPEKTRGRKPKELPRVVDALRTALTDGRYTLKQLLESNQESLRSDFCTSRSTIQRAVKALQNNAAQNCPK
jgi:hypothetical protein